MVIDYGSMAKQLKCEAVAMSDSLSGCSLDQLIRLRDYVLYEGYRKSVELGNKLLVLQGLISGKQAARELEGGADES